MDKETIQLILDMGASGKNVSEVTQELDKLKKATNEASASADKSKGKFADWNHEILTAGRAFQDFAQGGFGGILNNVEGLFRKFPAYAGIATGVATALYVATPIVKQFFTELINGSNEVPAAADEIGRLNETLDANKTRLSELRGQQTLTNDELAEFNSLSREQGEIQAALDEAKKKRDDANKLASLGDSTEGRQAKQVAADLQESIGGKQNELIGEVRDALSASSDELKAAEAKFDSTLAAFVKARDSGELRSISASRKFQSDLQTAADEVNRIRSDTYDKSVQLVADAVLHGNEGALNQIRQLAGPASQFAVDLQASQPEFAEGMKLSVERQKEKNKLEAEAVKGREEKEKEIAANFDKTKDNMERLGDQFRKNQENAAAAADKIATKLENAVESISEKLDKALAKWDDDNQETPWEAAVREAEVQNFGSVNPRTGRYEAGLKMSSEEVGRAAKMAEEFATYGGLDQMSALNMGIWGVAAQNQQRLAAKQNEAMRNIHGIAQQFGAIPSYLEFGG